MSYIVKWVEMNDSNHSTVVIHIFNNFDDASEAKSIIENLIPELIYSTNIILLQKE